MNDSFEGLGLSPSLAATLATRGYETPTPIQAELIPVILSGRDAIGQAPTGTGKTAAFSLPVIEKLKHEDSHVQVLVVAPTRELAVQVAETVSAYGKAIKLSVLPIFGGSAYGPQISKLKRGVDVVVGTPGRLIDLVDKRVLDLSQVSTVVLDEADEMLSMGFIEDIEKLLDQTPAERQTILMSATMPRAIRSLAKKYLRDAVSCSVKADREAPVVRQRAYLVNRQDKVAALSRLFETEDVTSALIFAKTRLGTEDLAAMLVERGVPAEALHGNMTQDARTRVVRRFRRGGIKVLVGTDVAARGLDIDDISHVVNFELPADPEVYVHRIGRTGRAGRGGDAITIYAPNETGKLRRIERFTGTQMDKPALPSVEDIEKLRADRLVERVQVWIRRGRCHSERDIIESMVEAGGDIVEIAAAALRLARTAEHSRPVERIGVVERRRPTRNSRESRGSRTSGDQGGRRPPTRSKAAAKGGSGSGFERRKDMIKVTLSAGSVAGLKVNNVVGMLAGEAGVPKEAIGRIWIEDAQTQIAVHESVAGGILARSGKMWFGKHCLDVVLS